MKKETPTDLEVYIQAIIAALLAVEFDCTKELKELVSTPQEINPTS